MKRFIYSCIMMLALSGCGGVDVQTEVGKSGDMAKLVTYSWLETGDTPLEGVRVRRPEVDQLVKASVEKYFHEKGYEKVAGNQPDFLVSWVGAVEQKIKVESINHFYSSYGYGPVAASMPVESKKGDRVREYEEGTILLDVLDPESHTMLWRGSGTARLLQGMKEEEAALYVNKLVKNILKTFPDAKK
ncbi:MAG: hypothetical protein ACI8ZB_003043 [Desulforhopalus sp.]|jgi:hypothetical protein